MLMTWMELMAESGYGPEDSKVYQCPAMANRPLREKRGYRVRGYGMYTPNVGDLSNGLYNASFLMLGHYDDGKPKLRGYTIINLSAPSEAFMMSDSASDQVVDACDVVIGDQYFCLYMASSFVHPCSRHGDRFNTSFMDGHIAALRPEEMGNLLHRNSNGTNAMYTRNPSSLKIIDRNYKTYSIYF